jgi:hypothetical protein
VHLKFPLLLQQQIRSHLKSRFRQGSVIHRHHRRIGDQLARNGEFVVGQGFDIATATTPVKASTTLCRVPEMVMLAQLCSL